MSALSILEEDIEFAENPEPRCPCVLLLDTSGSMQGAAIHALNEGLRAFKDDLMRDSLASRRVEIAIVTFNSQVEVVQDFVTADGFTPTGLRANGSTYMGGAVQMALDMIHARKSRYRENGIAYYRPWVFLITDGEPQGEAPEVVQEAARRIREEEESKRVAFFAVGVENANMTKLADLSVRAPIKLKGLNFVELFVWLSRSTQAVSHSQVGDQVALPPPTGWAAV
ncbi:MAG: VWA domain-containing protein [Armatimonadetes bacterium]|nr:VWA domain-containing protein [Armatimonadota bacterium]